MKALVQDIKNQNFKNVYLLYGQEEYLKSQYTKKLCQALLPEEDTMNFASFEGKGINVKAVIDLGQTMPFFAERRVILISNTGFFKNKCDELADYLGDIPEYLYLVFVESEVDKRSRMYKGVKKVGGISEFSVQDERTLMKWMLGMLGKENKKITQQDMEYLLLLTGTDMCNIQNEVTKLLDYTMGRDVITREDLDAICSGQVTNKIFEMIKALTERKQKRALELYYDLLALKEPPMRILFLIARQFNHLLQTKELVSNGFDQARIAAKIGVQSFVARNYITYARAYTLETLRNAVEECVQMEECVKTGRIQDTLSVELLIIKYSN